MIHFVILIYVSGDHAGQEELCVSVLVQQKYSAVLSCMLIFIFIFIFLNRAAGWMLGLNSLHFHSMTKQLKLSDVRILYFR